jgi:outer membrane protein assembly factor BamB
MVIMTVIFIPRSKLKMFFKLSLFLVLAANLLGCKPNEVIPKPQKEKSPIIWSKTISSDPASSLNSVPLYFNNLVILGKKENVGYTVYARNANTGDSVWKTTLEVSRGFNPIDGDETYVFEDKLIFSESRTLFVLDAQTGELFWKEVTDNPMRGGSCLIDGYLYKSDYVNRLSSTMYRYDINTGTKEALFTIKHGINEPGKDFTPWLNLPVKWIHPSGDEILVLQNRSYGYDKIGPDGKFGYSKMDLMAYNLTADSILWYRYEVDNFSSGARPAIDGDKVYFYGDRHAYCINPLNGETLWKYFIGDGPEDDFNTANILIHR